MHILKKAVISAAATSLLAFGVVAGSSGSALAVTGPSFGGCTAEVGVLALGVFPNCTADPSTINNPTSITITLNTTALGELLNVLPGLGMKASWTLSCVVNGSIVTQPGSFTVSSLTQSASELITLQSAVGSPAPNQCTISNLTATTTLALSIGALGLNPFTVGVEATATAATPGAMYANYPKDTSGAHAETCVDDRDNGDSGTPVQAFQCLSDLADYWLQMSDGQLVHNGDCLTDSNGTEYIKHCVANPSNGSGQVWQSANDGSSELINADSGGCLTAPTSGTIDSALLRLAACHSTDGQDWTIPPITIG